MKSINPEYRKAVLVSNGPGELYTWVGPVMQALKAYPIDITIALVPCQFSSGKEAAIAERYKPEKVISVRDTLRIAAGAQLPEHLLDKSSFVLSLGGNVSYALRIARRLKTPCYAYGFTPFWYEGLKKRYFADEKALEQTKLKGADENRLELVGNLVADVIADANGQINVNSHINVGDPHILLLLGSRPQWTVHILPFAIALVDKLGELFPQARFIWPKAFTMSQTMLEQGVSGKYLSTEDGIPGKLQGQKIFTPNGHCLEIVDESSRYQHMHVAHLALTLPGTNTLELGIAGVPSIISLPLNQPALLPIPQEGLIHWLSYLPLIGRIVKRKATEIICNTYVALPNIMTQEELMPEIKGNIGLSQVIDASVKLLHDEPRRQYIKQRLAETMPKPGAAERLVKSLMSEIGLEKTKV